MADKMEVVTLLLLFSTLPGCSHLLNIEQPKSELDRGDRPVVTFSKTTILADGRKESDEKALKVKTALLGHRKIREMVKSRDTGTPEEAKYDARGSKLDPKEKLRRDIMEEERESRLVAGIHLYEETRGDTEKEERVTRPQNPPSPPPLPPHDVPPPFSASTLLPGEVRSVSLLEDLLLEVFHSPDYQLGQNPQEVKAGPNAQEELGKNRRFKPAQVEPHTTREEINAERESGPSVAVSTEANATQFTHEPNTTRPPGRRKSLRLAGNDTKPAGRPNKSPRLTKSAARPRPTAARAPSARPTKTNRGGKNKAAKKKRKKDNKTQKPSDRKEEVATPTPFPYFLDDYCPPECACYGRVVQCSDKGVDKVPYGIPYNARYVLLMNNLIDSIQLDLLNEYVSMEFLVLSNNRLTDGSVEGAFEWVPALRRLHLDRNLLESVPTDLPGSLEELRLDNNRLGVMSEAAWARCPGLLVLSLSNNSLGNGWESLPDDVLSPLGRLRTLNLNHNRLTLVPVGLPLSVRELYLKGNLIEQFGGGAFHGISELVVLDLSSNRLTDKGFLRESLLNATGLESLNLEGNRLRQIPRHLPRSLKTLNLEGNLISSVKKSAFGALRNLEHLGLARNKLSRVASGAFRTLLVLHQLDLSHNALPHVPRRLPVGLHSVALAHNRIRSVPRDAFCWGHEGPSPSRLVRVQLEHNLMDMGRLDAQAFRCLRGFQVVHFY